MAKRSRRARSSAPARSNPDLNTTDLTEKVVPGFGAYAATRFLTRAAFVMADKRKMKSARTIAAGAGLAAAAAAWAFGDRVKQTQKYYEPILIGAGTAALQGIVQAFLPSYGWVVGDLPAQSATQAAAAAAAQPAGPSIADLLQNDDLEIGPLLLPGQPPPPGTVTQSQVQAQKEEDLIASLSDYNEMNDY